jgi:hypothetical protein
MACCPPEGQDTCCEPHEKADCCGSGEPCGCVEGAPTQLEDVRHAVREGYAAAVADPDMDDSTRADMREWTGCIAGALTAEEYAASLHSAGLVDVEVRETHRVHAHAGSAITRANKPSAT